MKTESLANLIEEITDRLRNAIRVSDAAEHAIQTGPQAQVLAQLCDEVTSLERVAAMLEVLGHVCGDRCSRLTEKSE